ncbi:hypothetical protein V6Z77_000414 [Aspergillus fumigatus]
MKEHQQMARPMDTVVLSISPVKGISASLRGALGRLGIQRQVSIIEDSSSLRSEKAQMTERLPDNMKEWIDLLLLPIIVRSKKKNEVWLL